MGFGNTVMSSTLLSDMFKALRVDSNKHSYLWIWHRPLLDLSTITFLICFFFNLVVIVVSFFLLLLFSYFLGSCNIWKLTEPDFLKTKVLICHIFIFYIKSHFKPNCFSHFSTSFVIILLKNGTGWKIILLFIF